MNESPHSMAKPQRRILIASLACVYVVYVTSLVGVVGSNDGSHYALVRAIAERRTFRVDDSHWPSKDVATDRYPIPPFQPPPPGGKEPIAAPQEPGEHFYSNKPPGTAVLALPFYYLGRTFDPWLQRYPAPATANGRGRFPDDWYRMETPFFSEAHQVGYTGSLADLRQSYQQQWQIQNCVNLLPALLGVLTTWLVYRLCRHVGTGFWPALATAWLAALGTIQWRYSTALFSHIPTAALLLVVLDGLAAGWAWRRRDTAVLWGLALGYLFAVQYQTGLFMPALIGYWIWRSRHAQGVNWFARGVLVTCGAAVPLVLIGAYHWSCFGSPLVNPVSRSRYFPYAWSMREMLSGSPLQATRSLWLQDPEASQITAHTAQAVRQSAHFTQFPLLAEPWPVGDRLREWMVGWLTAGNERRSYYLQGAGLLLTSPFLIAALLGWLVFGWRAARPAGLITALTALQIVFIAFVRAPTGGATYDARYLMAVIPLLTIGFGLLIQRISRWGAGSARRLCRAGGACLRWVAFAALAALGLASIVNMFHSMAVFQRHEIGLKVLYTKGGIAGWSYWIDWETRLAACFQSVGNWPLLLLALSIALIALLVGWIGRNCIRR